MSKREDYPIWTRGRAQRHLARGCSPRSLGLILGRTRRRAAGAPELSPPVAPKPIAETRPSNVLPFRRPAPRPALASAPGADLRLA